MARGVFWSVVGTVISRLLALAAGIVAAHILGKVAFGELGIIQSTLSMFGTFATFGVGLTATKHVAEYRKSDPERAGRVIAISYLVALLSGCAIALLMVVAAPLVATRSLGAPHLAGMVALSSAALLFLVLNEAQIGALSGLEAFRRRSAIQIYGGILAFPISLAGVYFFGLTGAVCAFGVTGAVLVALNAWGIRREATLAGIPIHWRGIRSEMGLVWRFNLPTLLCGSVYVPSMWLANLIMVNGPDGYAQMGLFSAADRWRTAVMFLPALLGGVALPMLSSLAGDSNAGQFRKLLRANVAISSLLSLLAAVPIAALAPWIMRSYGSDFTEGKWVLVILCGTAVMHAAYWVIGQSLVSKGRVWTIFRMNLGWAILLLVTIWFLRHHGAIGLATAYLVADCFRLAVGLILSRRLLGGQTGAPLAGTAEANSTLL
jgi:O-antigen/teichoic acid export membrane protein